MVRARMGVKLGMWISLLLADRSGSRDLTFGCTIWNISGKELLSVWCVCWTGLDWGGFTRTLFQEWDVWSEVLLEQVQHDFSFRNKFITLFPCGLLVDNNTFSKMLVSNWLHWLRWLWKPKCPFFRNNKFKVNEEIILVILNCTLLYDRNDGWTIPYPYLVVCCKNIYLRILYK